AAAPGRVRARRGLGAVCDHRLLDGRGLRDPRQVPGSAQQRVLDPEVVRLARDRDRRAGSGPAPPRRGGDGAQLQRPGDERRRGRGAPRGPRRRPRAGWPATRAARRRRRDGARLSRRTPLLAPDTRRIGRPSGPPARDRAPDELAAGTPEPLRGDLISLLGPERVLSRAIDLIAYASDASPYRRLPAVVVMAHDA